MDPVNFVFVGVLIAFFAAAWVFGDARKREVRLAFSLLLGLGTFLLCVPVLPLWLIFRPEGPVHTAPWRG